MPDIDSFFSPEGPLARTVSGYSPRAQQLEMAQGIAETIAANSVLVAEAGTGTGKTFAYLVPALLARRQSHRLHRHQDPAGPAVRSRYSDRARGAEAPVTVALLKGRANYVCHYHLERTLQEGRPSLISREEVEYLRLIERFAKRQPRAATRAA